MECKALLYFRANCCDLRCCSNENNYQQKISNQNFSSKLTRRRGRKSLPKTRAQCCCWQITPLYCYQTEPQGLEQSQESGTTQRQQGIINSEPERIASGSKYEAPDGQVRVGTSAVNASLFREAATATAESDVQEISERELVPRSTENTGITKESAIQVPVEPKRTELQSQQFQQQTSEPCQPSSEQQPESTPQLGSSSTNLAVNVDTTVTHSNEMTGSILELDQLEPPVLTPEETEDGIHVSGTEIPRIATDPATSEKIEIMPDSAESRLEHHTHQQSDESEAGPEISQFQNPGPEAEEPKVEQVGSKLQEETDHEQIDSDQQEPELEKLNSSTITTAEVPLDQSENQVEKLGEVEKFEAQQVESIPLPPTPHSTEEGIPKSYSKLRRPSGVKHQELEVLAQKLEELDHQSLPSPKQSKHEQNDPTERNSATDFDTGGPKQSKSEAQPPLSQNDKPEVHHSESKVQEAESSIPDPDRTEMQESRPLPIRIQFLHVFVQTVDSEIEQAEAESDPQPQVVTEIQQAAEPKTQHTESKEPAFQPSTPVPEVSQQALSNQAYLNLEQPQIKSEPLQAFLPCVEPLKLVPNKPELDPQLQRRQQTDSKHQESESNHQDFQQLAPVRSSIRRPGESENRLDQSLSQSADLQSTGTNPHPASSIFFGKYSYSVAGASPAAGVRPSTGLHPVISNVPMNLSSRLLMPKSEVQYQLGNNPCKPYVPEHIEPNEKTKKSKSNVASRSQLPFEKTKCTVVPDEPCTSNVPSRLPATCGQYQALNQNKVVNESSSWKLFQCRERSPREPCKENPRNTKSPSRQQRSNGVDTQLECLQHLQNRLLQKEVTQQRQLCRLQNKIRSLEEQLQSPRPQCGPIRPAFRGRKLQTQQQFVCLPIKSSGCGMENSGISKVCFPSKLLKRQEDRLIFDCSACRDCVQLEYGPEAVEDRLLPDILRTKALRPSDIKPLCDNLGGAGRKKSSRSFSRQLSEKLSSSKWTKVPSTPNVTRESESNFKIPEPAEPANCERNE